ncbi:MAG: glycosyltransferase family 4 protein [Anaerolineae bacterium]|nr:glycosyltransferase family 4 protein [Anaerolineae bacterium]
MRVCLDASPAVYGRAGIGRYVQELVAALVALDERLECTIFYNRARGTRDAAPRLEPPLDSLPRLTTALGDRPWRLSVLLAHLLRMRQDRLFAGVDLFHATDHVLPRVTGVRTVFTLHDLTFLLYPQAHSLANRWYLTLMMPRFLRATGAVVAVSECTRRDAVRLYGLEEARVRVIYPGVGPQFHPADPGEVAAVRRRYGLPERLILYVGTIEPRKNLPTLLRAYSTLRQRGCEHRLAIVGREGWRCRGFWETLKELGLGGEVLTPGYVPDADLPGLYGAAEVFVFPSLYEGFGLPVLEAMACGVPVVCSAASSLPEVAGEAALLVSPGDVWALAAAIERVLDDSALRARLRAEGLARARRFTWEAAARATLEVYAGLWC